MDRRMMTLTGSGKSDMNGWTDGVAYTDLTIVENSYCRARDGAFIAYNGWNRTDYVPCGGCSTITFPPLTGAGTDELESNRFFDANKQVVGGTSDVIHLSRSASVNITVPSNAEYFVISCTASALSACINAGIVPHA